jgi:hypothetical protein
MAQQLEPRVGQQVPNIVLGAGEKIVHAQHVVSVRQQTLAQVRPEKTGAARNQNAASL